MVYDIGVLSNHNNSAWETNPNIPLNRGTDGTTLTNSTSSNQHLYADITSGTSYDFTPPFKVEFNFEKLNTGEANTTLRLFDSSNNHFNPWITQTGHYIFDVKANRIDWSINGQAATGQNITLGASFVEFLLTPTASFKFSNFVIYEIQ